MSARTDLESALTALALELPEEVLVDFRARVSAALQEAAATSANVEIGKIEPEPGKTVLVTMPGNAPDEAIQAAAEAFARHFPDQLCLVRTENMTIEQIEEHRFARVADRLRGVLGQLETETGLVGRAPGEKVQEYERRIASAVVVLGDIIEDAGT